MFKKGLLVSALVAATMLSIPAKAQNIALSDLENMIAANPTTVESGKNFDKNHWAYHSLKNISKKYGLLVGDTKGKFEGDKALTRNEAAVILVNLVGKIEQDKLAVSESEKTKLEIMKNEFSNELSILTGRVDRMETTVANLQGTVAKVEAKQNKTLTHYYGEDFKIGGLLQLRYYGNISRGVDSQPSNFGVPLSEFRFKGKLAPHLTFLASMNAHRNFTSSSNGLLGDVYVATDILPHHNIYIGQTRVPIGIEGSQSPTTLHTMSRSQAARNFGDFRDTGVKVAGKWKYADYYLGLYNGSGINTTDSTNDVLTAYWATFKPLADRPEWGHLELGGGFVEGTMNTLRNIDIFGCYAKYNYKRVTLQSEWSKMDGYSVSGRQAQGFYLTTLYDLTDKAQLVAKYDVFDPNRLTTRDITSEYTLGANYFFRGKALKLQANSSLVNNDSGKDSFRVGLLSQYMF